MDNFDIAIIGGGIAGLTAAIYASRAGKSVCVFEKTAVGGQILKAHKIDNYPALPAISGYELMDKVLEQSKSLGAVIKYENALRVEFDKKPLKIITDSGEYGAGSIILASGAFSRPLNIKGEKELTGTGVSYCATCDGMFFKDQTVVVAGSGEPAINDVKYLSPIVNKIYLVSKKPPEAELPENTEFIEAEITEVKGNPLSTVGIRKAGKNEELSANGLFVAIGSVPATDLTGGRLNTDEKGYIITDEYMRTNIENVYAVGDVRKSPLKQLVTAAADGAIAGTYASKKKKD